MRVFRFRDPAALAAGLREQRRAGLTPRGLLFAALDPRGEIYLATLEDLDAVASVRVGEKLSLVPPWMGQYHHFDAIHRLPGDAVLWNGDRRLGDLPTTPAVAAVIAEWTKASSAKNVFLGCGPHIPGSWWARGEKVVALSSEGYMDCAVTNAGVLARKVEDAGLWYLPFASLVSATSHLGQWQEVFRSDLGALLLIERRLIGQRLVLTCEHGLVEIDVGHLPDLVIETARVTTRAGFGVVGRMDGGAFAVATGTVTPWGLVNLSPAMLVGAPHQRLTELPAALRAQLPSSSPQRS
jgi:hypothetical protein